MDAEAPSPRLEQLERQLRLGWRQLLFESPELEDEFRQQYQLWSKPFRLTLIVVAAILVAITPLLDLFLLHPPEAFAVPVHRVQLLIMLPVLIFAGACSAVRSLQRWADFAGLFAVSVVIGSLLYQRHLGAGHGVWVPTELVTATLAGGYVMGGLRFWRTTVVAVAILIATVANEFLGYGATAATQYIAFGVLVQGLIAGLAGYLQEHFARGTWLRNELLAILATRDSLTGLLNFRAFEPRFQELWSRAARDGKPILVAVLDLDYFKQYNDAYGHSAGNLALRRIAEKINLAFGRDCDVAARMGGEEFSVVAYDIERDTSSRLLEYLRDSVEALRIPHQRSNLPSRVVTISGGAHWTAGVGRLRADAALQEADRCLYEAKGAGRNCVIFSDDRRLKRPVEAKSA